jgi:hypothetical protein
MDGCKGFDVYIDHVYLDYYGRPYIAITLLGIPQIL